MLKKITLFIAIILSIAFAPLHASAQTTYDGDLAHKIEIVNYGVGDNNNAVGIVKNSTNQTVQVTLEFKGYAADGMVSQTVARANIENLGPNESARFSAVGFFEKVKRVTLIKVSTLPR